MLISLAPGITHIKVILHVRAWGNWALGDSNRTIHNTGALLAHAVPMDSRGLISKAVVDIDDQLVAHVHVNLRAGPLAIDTDDRALKSIGGSINPTDVPVQVDIFRCG